MIYNGVDARFFDPTPLTAHQRQALGLEQPYVLHFGGASERKNLGALAEAWPTVRRARRPCSWPSPGRRIRAGPSSSRGFRV
ncbi:hypothetical protein [Nesterenkonia pannonica]|uniref:hypothetical protein n=1 Tax=Nesterenkonia pannonica TaxID=1548602 RepID=UPI002164BD49|nr:hypothetical protein [Nesterenkonia pannonica]